jgi:hypothetical protein
MTGIQGYSRIAPGDTFEVSLRHGPQKHKAKGKVQKLLQQHWDKADVSLKCLFDEPLYVKVSIC